MTEQACAHEGVSIQVAPTPAGELLLQGKNWKPRWILEKKNAEGEVLERIEEDGNLLLNAGITEMWKLIAGETATAFNSGALLGVGDSSTAEAASQTDLQASTNKLFKTVKAAPTVSGQKISWQADFVGGEAEFKWKEVGLKNSAGTLLNRKVNTSDTTNGWGDKAAAAGSTWTLTLEITLQ